MRHRWILSHLVLISLLVSPYLGMLTLPESFKDANAEKVFGSLKIVSAYSNDGRNKRDISDSFPEHISCELRVSGETMGLDLHRNRNVDGKKPVYVMRNGKIVLETISTLKDVEYFQDTESGAALAVICETKADGTCEYRVEGIVTMGGDRYLVYPTEEQQEQHPGVSYAEGESPYVVEKLNSTVTNFSDYIVSDFVPQTVPERFGRVRRKTKKVNYNVELMMVTDTSVYKFWFDKTAASTTTERRALTLSRIRQYYAFVANAVDLRYKNIKETDLALNVLYSGLLIIEDPTVSFWTDGIARNNPEDASRKMIDSDQAYTSFTQWVQGRKDLPKSDHVMLFTAYDLSRKGETSNTGLAYVRSICSRRSTSICENLFDFDRVETAAHELGHSLGASHDGDGNACPAADSYIMTPTSGLAKGANAKNPWYFSSCSIAYFREKIRQLDSADDNCLLSESSSLDRTILTPLLQALPGQVYHIDTQCAYSHGESSTFCRSFYNQTSYEDICTGLYCSIPGTTFCRKVMPARGTSCGQNKWCDNGACVYNSNAPAVSASCPLEEYPGVINRLNLTCTQMIQSRSDLCYREHFNQQCCESCPMIQTNQPNCQFGDKSSSCGEISAALCYIPKNEDLCCESCAKLKRANQPECQFGDKDPDCSNITPAHCYVPKNEGICCETCATFKKRNQTGCVYGDKSTSCSGIRPSQCYSPSNEDLCCETCAKFKRKDQPGCLFGDKSTKCSGIKSAHCYTASNRDLCCESCAELKKTGRPGCEYGDKYTGCKVNDCTSPSYIKNCCGMCNK
ncbi:zinc metalloproteinase/disintegrin-like [Liolophura sinensis]|uniref:zinc metalloproteinase/disintegrin-like n=1 Tax=Liolophura sinensis TaxID=3198878 RepID=UPI003158B1C6